jgi:hypothetical protein
VSILTTDAEQHLDGHIASSCEHCLPQDGIVRADLEFDPGFAELKRESKESNVCFLTPRPR